MKEFDGMTKDWLILIFREFKKHTNSNKKIDELIKKDNEIKQNVNEIKKKLV